MKQILFTLLLLTQVFVVIPVQGHSYPQGLLRDWTYGSYVFLNPTERKPARTAILIMCSSVDSDTSYTECRWLLGKKIWEQYMNLHPNVDCYFLQNTKRESSETVWIEGNTIYVEDHWYLDQGIERQLNRTILAIEKLLPKYTHFIRTNVNAFFNLKAVNEYAETHHESMFTGPIWENQWYIIGYGIFFSADVAAHIVSEYRRLQGKDIVSYLYSEDGVITSLATGVYPYNYGHIHEFTCCPTIPFGTRQLMCNDSFTTTRLSKYGLLLFPAPSFEQTIEYCNQALNTALLYRIRSGYDLDKLAQIYEYLLKNIYPEASDFDLVEYAKSLPYIQDNT